MTDSALNAPTARIQTDGPVLEHKLCALNEWFSNILFPRNTKSQAKAHLDFIQEKQTPEPVVLSNHFEYV